MDTVSTLGAALFVAAWSLTALGFLVSLVESIAVWLLAPWVFALGPRVLHLRRTMARPIAPVASHWTSSTGRFRVLPPNVCLFAPRRPLWAFRVRTAFPIKGRITWEGSDAEVQGRLPLGAVIFTAGWLLAATIWCILVWNSPDFATWAPLIMLGAWLFASGLSWWSIRFEVKQAIALMAEFETHAPADAA